MTDKDVVNIDDMDKDQLEQFALAKHGVELDKRQKLSSLQTIVKKLEEGNSGDGGESKPAAPAGPSFLRHPTNHRVYKTTPLLLARGDMIGCNKDGKNV